MYQVPDLNILWGSMTYNVVHGVITEAYTYLPDHLNLEEGRDISEKMFHVTKRVLFDYEPPFIH